MDRRDRRDRRDRKGSEGSLPIVRDRKRSEGSEKLKNGRGLADNWKLGLWEFENLKVEAQGNLKIRWKCADGWLAGEF